MSSSKVFWSRLLLGYSSKNASPVSLKKKGKGKWKQTSNKYVNVSDETSIFTQKTKMFISLCEICFLASNVLDMTKTFQKKRPNSPKKTIQLFCTIVTHSVLLCYTAIGHFGWVRWDPKWPWAPWHWVGMTFQAFRGSSGAQIAFTILSATSIGNRVTQCTAHERGVANAVTIGQNQFF